MAQDTFVASYEGIGELLRADFIKQNMIERAQNVMAEAIATSPHSKSNRRPKYSESFSITSGLTEQGGGLRCYARVTNSSNHAAAVEYGWKGTPKYRTLGRALYKASGGRRA